MSNNSRLVKQDQEIHEKKQNVNNSLLQEIVDSTYFKEYDYSLSWL